MVKPAQRPMCEHCGCYQARRGRRYCSNCYRNGVRRGGKFQQDGDRPFCQCCDIRRACGSGRFCSRCYSAGAAHRAATIPPIVRPENLVDTGLRIIDAAGVVVYPSGRRKRVPPTFVFDFFFEAVTEDRDGLPLVLRVLRVAKETANA